MGLGVRRTHTAQVMLAVIDVGEQHDHPEQRRFKLVCIQIHIPCISGLWTRQIRPQATTAAFPTMTNGIHPRQQRRPLSSM